MAKNAFAAIFEKCEDDYHVTFPDIEEDIEECFICGKTLEKTVMLDKRQINAR